jgi:hypothetical protein
MKKFARLSLFTSVVLVATAAAHATTYYVSTTGANNPYPTNGSSTAPWKTITYAIGQVAAGDTILVHAGTYGERVLVSKSLTLQSYPGETATVDGGNVAIVNNGAYAYGLVDIGSGVSNVTVSGLQIQNFIVAAGTLSTANLVPAGVHVEGAGSNINILNNKIHDIKNLSTYVNGTHDGSCGGSPPSAFGLVVAGTNATTAMTHVTITGNQLYNLVTGCSESMTVNGNVDTFTVSENTVHDNSNIAIAALGGEGTPPGRARNGSLIHNVIYNIYSGSQCVKGPPCEPWDVYGNGCTCADGIYADGSDSILIDRNEIYNVDVGMEAASENAGQYTTNITIRNNVVSLTTQMGIGIGCETNTCGKTGQSAGITVVNNSFYNTDEGSGTLILGKDIVKNTTNSSGTILNQYPYSILFENNIVYTDDGQSSGTAITGKTGSAGMTYDYNIYYGAKSPFTEGHSFKNTDPLFVNAGATPPDLDTQSDSPARGAGTDPGASIVGTLDFAGNPRVVGTIDIGAYEH